MTDCKFKPGDRVRQVEASTFPAYNAPGEHIVRRCTPSNVKFVGDTKGYMPHRFKLVRESYPDTVKNTNPKDAVGTKKPPLSTVSSVVIQEVGVAMLEGARKYGRHNYRVSGVRDSVYYDATMRHLMAWWEGEDIDPDSGLSHITKAIASLTVLRDAQINRVNVDDRPPKVNTEYKEQLQERVDDIFERHPEAVAAHTELHQTYMGVKLDD